MAKRKRKKTEATRRAFAAKRKAEKLGISREVWQELERQIDRDHAYFSSLVSGTTLTKAEFDKIMDSEESGG